MIVGTVMGIGSFSSILRTMGHFIPIHPLRILLYRASGTKIGKGTIIDRHVAIGPNVEIGMNCSIHDYTKLHNCVFGNDVKVEPYCLIRYSKMGDRCLIDRGSQVYGSPVTWVKIGNDVEIGSYWKVDGTGGLEIEDGVTLGSHIGGLFTHSNVKQCLQGYPNGEKDHIERKPVKIEKCSWIGGIVTIQPGVTIGHHCVILPHSIVTRDVESFTMVTGNPAKVIKRIKLIDDKTEFLSIED
jgi:acetyltransferase-like isoleucine patch superfamily enzyme